MVHTRGKRAHQSQPPGVATIREIFKHVQYNKTSHEKDSKKLRAIYEKADEKAFVEEFINCLRVVFLRPEKHLHVTNIIHFAAKFAVSLYSCSAEEEAEEEEDEEAEENISRPQSLFIRELIKFLLDMNDVVLITIRYRVCQFLNLFLNSMGESAYIDDETCNKVMTAMMNRLLDKSPKVRAQAVYTLFRLQDPSDENCPVTKMYIFHLTKDPSVDVRLAVIKTIAKSQKSLAAIFKRTRDISEFVRKEAYLFISKVTLRSLRIKQRDSLLKDGFNDPSEQVRKVVREEILPRWLKHFHDNYLDLLHALDAQTASAQAILAITTLFHHTDKTILIGQLPVDPDNKLIIKENLTAENAVYWKCLVQHLHKENRIELLDDCMPELSSFCNYIRDYQQYITEKELNDIEKSKYNFIHYQLFEISKVYDLSDEVGRKNLVKLCEDTLMSEICTEKMIELIVEHFESLVPDVNIRIDSLANVISEIRSPSKLTQIEIPEEEMSEEVYNEKRVEIQKIKMKVMQLEEEMYQKTTDKQFLEAHRLSEEIKELQKTIDELQLALKGPPIIPQPTESNESNDNNDSNDGGKSDPETMQKCLQIVFCLMRQPSIKKLSSTLRSFFDHMAMPNLENPSIKVRISALQVIAVSLLLDADLAKNYWALYFLQLLKSDHSDAWTVSLKAIFDLFLFYGLDFFNVHYDDINATENNKRHGSHRLRSMQDDEDEMDLIETNEDINQDIIKMLINLIDSDENELRTLVTEGFCKLLLHKRLISVQLVSRLIILLFNPATENDDDLRQSVILLFQYFVPYVPESLSMLERAFMPTLKTILNAPDNSPLQEIEPHRVAEFILNLTDTKVNKSAEYNVHNSLAITILSEALLPDSEIDKKTLVKTLKHLNIISPTDETKRDIEQAIAKIVKVIPSNDKTLLNCIGKFRASVMRSNGTNNEQQDDENKEGESQDEEDEESEDSN